MDIKVAKNMLKSYSGMTHKLSDNAGRPKLDQAIETVLQELDNSISKDKVREKLEKDKNEYELMLKHQSEIESNRTKYLRGRIHLAEELLEDK